LHALDKKTFTEQDLLLNFCPFMNID